MSPKNMPLWQNDYFKLQESEKWQVQEGLSDLLLHKTLIWEMPSLHLEVKEHPYLQRQSNAEKNPKAQALLVSPSLLPVAHVLYVLYHVFPHFLLFINPTIKMFRLNHFFGSSFPYEGSFVM